MNLLKYNILVTVILAIDLLWIFAMKAFYNRVVYRIQGTDVKVRMIPAVLSYVCVVFGVISFSIPLITQRLNNETRKDIITVGKWCLIYGGGLGLVMYGVFNFTNMAMFSKYDMITSIVDTLWGIVLCTTSTFIYFIILSS